MPQLSGLVMHVGTNLSYGTRREVEQNVMHHEGVASAYFNESRPQFMVIEYDPQLINSFEIMKEVHSNALQAARIG